MEENKCLSCNEKEIKYIKRGLCQRCYTLLRNHGELESYPNVRERLPYKSHKTDTPTDLLKDMKLLADNNNLTLRQLGDKYNMTGENVRQLFARVNGFKYTALKNVRSDKRKNNTIAKSILKKDPRNKLERFKEGSFAYKGAQTEKAVFNICAILNYEIKPYLPDQSIDLIINGYLVEIKSAHRLSFTSKGQTTGYYHFGGRKSQLKADFIICHAVPVNKFFIIPQALFTKDGSMYIPAKKSNTWQAASVQITTVSHWYDYEEAWHLLRPQEKKEMVFHEAATLLQ